MPEEAPKKKLGEFLVKLIMYRSLMDDFQESPDNALKDSGLSEEKKAILLSFDLTKILKELADEYGPKPGDHFVA